MKKDARSLRLGVVWFTYGLFYCACGKSLCTRAFRANTGLIRADIWLLEEGLSGEIEMKREWDEEQEGKWRILGLE